MSPRTVSAELLRTVPLLRADQDLASAVRTIQEARVPALPVLGTDGKLAGILGEREFIAAIFPGYLRELKYAAFLTSGSEEQIDLREQCGSEPVSRHMNTEHIDVPTGYSDAQLAEIFLHHRVLIVPVADRGEVAGIVTRWDFFSALVGRLPS